MNLLGILLIVCSAWMCQAYPHEKLHDHDHEHHHHHDIIDLAAKIVAYKMKDISNESETFKPTELMSCIPQDYRTKVHELCDVKLHEQPGQDHSPPAAAECVLTMIKALDNVTGLLDLAVLKMQSIDISSLTAEQKKLASTKLESCVESNFTLLDLPLSMAAKNMTMEKMSPVTKKYSQRSNPMRVIVCVAYALIENGCSSVAVDMKADLVASPVGLHSFVSSEGNSDYDGGDYYDDYGDSSYA
ncbi:uncharacterized protein LOC124313319 isoform X2 [Daphnia pulicaria]|uniref:uncharacterized protein LOC124313319 isoform X2 n=1 Tax=Daphnia pulicaria TaxID=35523 RepID=UPI001EEA3DAE|nr:uncharacterized protein LOC124313319 isoform X2 [Daphnia pulicaria]